MIEYCDINPYQMAIAKEILEPGIRRTIDSLQWLVNMWDALELETFYGDHGNGD